LHLKWPPIAKFFVNSDEKQEDDNIYTLLQLTVAAKNSNQLSSLCESLVTVQEKYFIKYVAFWVILWLPASEKVKTILFQNPMA